MSPSKHADFDAEFPEMYRAAYRSAFRILGTQAAAEDAACEAAYRAAVQWGRIKTFAVPWTVRVATNLALDSARRSVRFQRLRRDAAADHESVTAGERLDLVTALKALPGRQREVVVLRYLADLSEAETAALLDMAPGTVKSHASRGLAALRQALQPPHEELSIGAHREPR